MLSAERAALSGLAGLITGLAGLLYLASRSRPLGDAAPPLPPSTLPPARIIAVAGRGEMLVRECAAPNANAPTVVLLHGWLLPADVTWFGCYRPLAAMGRVLAIDHRGHGRGSRPSAPFRLADAADDVAVLLRQLGTEPAVVVGYSMGGSIAQLLARRHPDLVRGLVLCASAASFADRARERWLWRGMGLLQIVLRLLPRFWWERLARAGLEGRIPLCSTRLITAERSAEVAELLPWIIGELGRGSAEDLAEAGRELGRYDARAWLPFLEVPAAVVITAKDQFVLPHRQRQLAELIADARIVEVDLDHFAPMADPELFCKALSQAVTDVLIGDPTAHDRVEGAHG